MQIMPGKVEALQKCTSKMIESTLLPDLTKHRHGLMAEATRPMITSQRSRPGIRRARTMMTTPPSHFCKRNVVHGTCQKRHVLWNDVVLLLHNCTGNDHDYTKQRDSFIARQGSDLHWWWHAFYLIWSFGLIWYHFSSLCKPIAIYWKSFLRHIKVQMLSSAGRNLIAHEAMTEKLVIKIKRELEVDDINSRKMNHSNILQTNWIEIHAKSY